jgi:hypothetical protein
MVAHLLIIQIKYSQKSTNQQACHALIDAKFQEQDIQEFHRLKTHLNWLKFLFWKDQNQLFLYNLMHQ